MASEKEAELSYRALKPLYFGASAEGIALRHLLPDIYEAWDELCVAFRYMFVCMYIRIYIIHRRTHTHQIHTRIVYRHIRIGSA